MINQFLESLESPERPLLAPNYWILRRIGCILPENKLSKSLHILLHVIGSLFVFTQCIELYAIRSNLDLVLTNLKILLLSMICIIKANTFILWQNKWGKVIEYVDQADKFERENQDPPRGKIIEAYTKYCRTVTYFYWALVFTTFLTTNGQPLLRYITSPVFRENYRNGEEGFPHIFSSWMPFDKNKFPGCWITVIWHILICAYGATVVAAYDSSVVVIMVFFGGKLDLLRERCRLMLGVNGVGISDEEATANVKDLHGIHGALIKHSRLFNSLLSPVMFFYVIMCSMMLCASAFQLTSASNAAQKLLMAQYLIFGITQLFIFCWHSNDVLVKNENVFRGPYESQWWIAPVKQRKFVILFSGQLLSKVVFSAGPYVNLTLATFIAILKGAYSYYTFLRK